MALKDDLERVGVIGANTLHQLLVGELPQLFPRTLARAANVTSTNCTLAGMFWISSAPAHSRPIDVRGATPCEQAAGKAGGSPQLSTSARVKPP